MNVTAAAHAPTRLPSTAALLGVLGQLSGSGDDGAAITFYVTGGGSDANAILDNFAATQLGPLTAWLNTVRAGR